MMTWQQQQQQQQQMKQKNKNSDNMKTRGSWQQSCDTRMCSVLRS
jgi:hypothetical protein